MPNRDSIYHETNDLVSKNLLANAYTPSLVWNRSFLIPKRPKFYFRKDGSDGRRLGLKEVQRSVDNAILEFLKGNAGRGFRVDPCIDGNLVLFSGAFAAGSVTQGRKAMALERNALSSLCARVLDSDERALLLRGEYRATSRPSVVDVYDMAIRIHIRTNLFTLSVIATPRNGDLIALQATEDFKYFTLTFWDVFSASVLQDLPRRDLAAPALQGMFADSRGVIVSSFTIASSEQRHRVFDRDTCWAEPVIRRFAPILTSLGAGGCTASYMLDKRAVSLTTFGNEPEVQLDAARRPLTFLICIHGEALKEHEQGWAMLMGHVLDRAHTITTMRLAALLDLKQLRAASIALAKVDDLKATAREAIGDYEEHEIAADRAHRAVDALRRRLAEINGNFLEANAAGVGLTFRIESSRYYIEEFRKHVDGLRLSPIDGYQSYAQTIDQSIGIIFEFISRLGVRYDRLVRETRSIEQSFSTVQTRHTGNLIAEIQRNGELLLIGALVPYYLISIFAHISGAPETYDCTKSLLWQSTDAAIFLGCASFAIYRFQVSKNRTGSLKTKAARYSLGWQLAYAAVIAGGLLVTATAVLHGVSGGLCPSVGSEKHVRAAERAIANVPASTR